jgi:hypothetical protein
MKGTDTEFKGWIDPEDVHLRTSTRLMRCSPHDFLFLRDAQCTLGESFRKFLRFRPKRWLISCRFRTCLSVLKICTHLTLTCMLVPHFQPQNEHVHTKSFVEKKVLCSCHVEKEGIWGIWFVWVPYLWYFCYCFVNYRKKIIWTRTHTYHKSDDTQHYIFLFYWYH